MTDAESQPKPGSYVARCSECEFRATGFEAFCRRKAAHHAREYGHKMMVGHKVMMND